MKKIWILVLILGLMLAGNSCGRSTEKSKAEHAIEEYEEELNLMEKEVIKEESEGLGEDMGGLEAPEKDWGDEDEYPDI